jgi:hypothetical protein
VSGISTKVLVCWNGSFDVFGGNGVDKSGRNGVDAFGGNGVMFYLFF